MEIAGFAVSVVALAGLFNNAVQCFEYVKLSQDFKLDFATSQLNLALAQKRLARWGKALGLDRVMSEEQLPVNRSSDEERRQAEIVLKHLINRFHEAEERSKSYREQSNPTALTQNVSDTALIEGSEITVSTKLKKLSTNSLNKVLTKTKNQTK
jgi:hypothetical protein